MITSQAILHFMVSTHLFMETGQNLPLISHGGTSMLCTAAALGIILSISRQANNHTLTPPEGTAGMTVEDNE
jgi:cell division protein FtsW